MKRIAVITALVMALAALSVYAIAQMNNQDPEPDIVQITIITAQSNTNPTPITVKQGSSFTISLDSNRTTGYQWQPAREFDPKVLNLTNSVYSAPQDQIVGQPGVEIWKFEAIGKGKTIIELDYVRPWEKDVKPAKTQKFEVTVI